MAEYPAGLRYFSGVVNVMSAVNYPLITIGVSAYNRKDYLQQSLDSLINQSYPNCEIIVVDDGSSDGTAEMMREKYPHIKYVYQNNAGDAAAKNHAARIAQGEFIVFNDSDDLFLPDAVMNLYNALNNNKNACSYGTYTTIDAQGNRLPTKRKAAVYPSGNITGDLLEHILVNSCATLIPLKLYQQFGGFNENLKVAADYSFYLELSLVNEFYAVQEPVFLRRRHANNISSASYKKIHTVLDVLEDFLQRHTELEAKYAQRIRRRRADLHNKLYREAAREKLAEQKKIHAREAFKYIRSVRNFFRMIFG